MKNQYMLQFCHVSILAVALATAGGASQALADTRAGADVAVAVRVATNQFNSVDTSGTAVTFSPAITPWLRYEDPDTTVEAQGNLKADQSISNARSGRTLGANILVLQRVSSRLSVQGAVSYSDINSGLNDYLLSRSGSADEVVPPGTPIPDITTAGFRTRTQNLSGRVGASLSASARDSFSLNISTILNRTDAINASDSVNQVVNLGYTRQFSSRTSGYLTGQFTNVDYLRTSLGDGTIYNPQAGITQRFSDRLTLDLSAGVSLASFSLAGGGQQSFTSFSGNLRLCNIIARGAICLNGTRVAQPLALGGITNTSNVILAVDKNVGRRNTVNISARYTRVDQSRIVQLINSPSIGQEFIGVSANFNRKFDERFSIFITPSYSKAFNNVASQQGISQDGNFEVRAGLRYRFGAI